MNDHLRQQAIPKEDTLSASDNDDFFGEDLSYGQDYGMGNAGAPMERHADLLKQLTNFKQYIKNKTNGWLGLVWSEEKKEWVRDPDLKPIMNKRCASWCVDFLETYARDNNIITHIGREEYVNIVTDIIDVVWLDVGTRPESFGIRSDADLHRICVELQHACELVLMGAGDGKYNKFLSEVTQRNENVSYNPYAQREPAQKRGFWAGIKKRLTG